MRNKQLWNEERLLAKQIKFGGTDELFFVPKIIIQLFLFLFPKKKKNNNNNNNNHTVEIKSKSANTVEPNKWETARDKTKI